MEPKNLSPPPAPAVQSQARLLTCGSCWTAAHQQQLIQLAAFLTPHTQWFISQLEVTVSSQEYLKELKILLFQRALYNLPSRDVLKKEIIISFCIITISASNLYMPMIRLYVFLLDFLIPFLCDPDLQCSDIAVGLGANFFFFTAYLLHRNKCLLCG
jgi:hypothetical protein